MDITPEGISFSWCLLGVKWYNNGIESVPHILSPFHPHNPAPQMFVMLKAEHRKMLCINNNGIFFFWRHDDFWCYVWKQKSSMSYPFMSLALLTGSSWHRGVFKHGPTYRLIFLPLCLFYLYQPGFFQCLTLTIDVHSNATSLESASRKVDHSFPSSFTCPHHLQALIPFNAQVMTHLLQCKACLTSCFLIP